MTSGFSYWPCHHYHTHMCSASVTTEGDRMVKEASAHNYSGDSPDYQEVILHDSGVEDVDRIICMCDINLLTHLNGDGTVLMCDDTYETIPIIFFKLYTIHTKVGSTYP